MTTKRLKKRKSRKSKASGGEATPPEVAANKPANFEATPGNKATTEGIVTDATAGKPNATAPDVTMCTTMSMLRLLDTIHYYRDRFDYPDLYRQWKVVSDELVVVRKEREILKKEMKAAAEARQSEKDALCQNIKEVANAGECVNLQRCEALMQLQMQFKYHYTKIDLDLDGEKTDKITHLRNRFKELTRPKVKKTLRRKLKRAFARLFGCS